MQIPMGVVINGMATLKAVELIEKIQETIYTIIPIYPIYIGKICGCLAKKWGKLIVNEDSVICINFVKT